MYHRATLQHPLARPSGLGQSGPGGNGRRAMVMDSVPGWTVRRQSRSRSPPNRRKRIRRVRKDRHAPPVSPSRRLPRRFVDDLFKAALCVVLKFRHLPFNISVISDCMTEIHPSWSIRRTDYGTFSNLCRVMEQRGLLRVKHSGESIVISESTLRTNEFYGGSTVQRSRDVRDKDDNFRRIRDKEIILAREWFEKRDPNVEAKNDGSDPTRFQDESVSPRIELKQRSNKHGLHENESYENSIELGALYEERRDECNDNVSAKADEKNGVDGISTSQMETGEEDERVKILADAETPIHCTSGNGKDACTHEMDTLKDCKLMQVSDTHGIETLSGEITEVKDKFPAPGMATDEAADNLELSTATCAKFGVAKLHDGCGNESKTRTGAVSTLDNNVLNVKKIRDAGETQGQKDVIMGGDSTETRTNEMNGADDVESMKRSEENAENDDPRLVENKQANSGGDGDNINVNDSKVGENINGASGEDKSENVGGNSLTNSGAPRNDGVTSGL